MNHVHIDHDDGTPLYRGSMCVPVKIEVDVDVEADSCGELHASITAAEWRRAYYAALSNAIDEAKERWEGE